MGSSSSTITELKWPQKGEIRVYSKSFNKISENTEIAPSLQNASFTPFAEYQLRWSKDKKSIFFSLQSTDARFKCTFQVDTVSGRLRKYEYDQNNISNTLDPNVMWKCWVECWSGQKKENPLMYNQLDDPNPALTELYDMANLVVKIRRQRKQQIQLVSREVSYILQEKSSKGIQYQLRQQQNIWDIWIFNWNLKAQIDPQVLLQEFPALLGSELHSIQNTTG